MADTVVTLFNLYEKPSAEQSIEISVPKNAALIKIQIIAPGLPQGRYVVSNHQEWRTLDPEFIQDGKIKVIRDMFPVELPESGFKLSIGYMTEETLKAAQEYGVEIPLSPVVALAINEKAFVIELDDGTKIAVDRNMFDTFARQASNGVRSKVNFTTGEASATNQGLNYANKGCSGCKKPNPFQG